jgi:hypothetical protein
MRIPVLGLFSVIAGGLFLSSISANSRTQNGFDLTDSLVPASEIHMGGPPRDGIPSIDQPTFVAAPAADFLSNEDEVLGIEIGGEAKAYPISILNWHEIVNDRLAGERIAVTFCPLCGTGVILSSEATGHDLSFGVSGLLYNSDVLLYDRQTESLWSQIKKKAISGPMRGESLEALPLTHTTWQAWRKAHPKTRVLSTDTGFARDYNLSPYGGYARGDELYFPVNRTSRQYHPKERVLGVEIGGHYKAYPFAELAKNKADTFEDEIAGRRLTIRFDEDSESATAFDEDGQQLAAITGFWFAWYAFHPDTEVFKAALN